MVIKTTVARLLRAIRKHKYLVIALIASMVLAGIVAYRFGMQQAAQTVEDNPAPTAASAVIRIQTSLPNITVHGTPYCDSQKLNKTPPYSCKLGENALPVTLTVDEEVTYQNKKYHFKTWDGCSFSNTSKNICRVTGQVGKISIVKATYAEGPLPQDDTSKTPSSSSPTSSAKPTALPNPCQPTPLNHRNKQHIGDDLFEQFYGYCSVPAKAGNTIKIVKRGAEGAGLTQWVTCYNEQGIDATACTTTDKLGHTSTAGYNTPMYVQPDYTVAVHRDTTLVMSTNKETTRCESIPFSKVPACYERYKLANWSFTKTADNAYSLGPIYEFVCNNLKAPLCGSN